MTSRSWAAVVSLLTVCVLAVTAGSALAAAPSVTPAGTTTLTTNGRTALTYTGYMNGESFQQNGITTFNGRQYAAFWDQSGYVNLSRRQLPSGTWQNLQLTDYRTTSTDSHNVISIGISAQDGTIHLAFDMHSSQLKYRRSVPGLATSLTTTDWGTGSFGPVVNSLAGQSMPMMTYPQFIVASDQSLQLALRTGTSGSGDEVLYEYSSGTWSQVGTFIDGITYNDNAYLFGIEYDRSGRLHVTWTVRETPDASTNHDLYYAYSNDKGRTWRSNTGVVAATTGTAPLASNAANLKVWTIGQNRGLMNQESQVVDSTGVVHVLASHLPASAASNPDFTAARNSAVLVHYWREPASAIWHQDYTPFLERSARADIGVDTNDNLYIASGDSSTYKLHIETASRASNWSDWTIRYTSSPIYYSDPLIDHERLLEFNVLSIFAPRYGGSQIDVQDWNTAA